jgi:hypothetical protein
MMRYGIMHTLLIVMITAAPCVQANEFIKKSKQKKESTGRIKQDVVDQLESIARKIGENIQQSVEIQNLMFDLTKEIMNDERSGAGLHELRKKLESALKKLEEQQVELQRILVNCK